MPREAKIRNYTAGDEQKIVELLEEVFSGWPKLCMECAAYDHWRWKYLEAPTGESMILVADADEIVGVVHSIPYRLKIGNDLHDAHYISDLVVHPTHRRLNIADDMIKISIDERRRRRVRFSYFVTSNPILIKYNLKMEGVHVFPHKVVNMVRIRDLDKQLSAIPMKKSRLMKTGYLVLDALNKISRQPHEKGDREKIKVRQINEFHGEFDDFWERILPNYDFIGKRDAEWLNWRYCDSRAGDYKIISAEKGSEIVGYCV